MMLWVDMLLRFYVVIEPYYVFWQMEQPIEMYFKGGNTIKTSWYSPKIKTPSYRRVK